MNAPRRTSSTVPSPIRFGVLTTSLAVLLLGAPAATALSPTKGRPVGGNEASSSSPGRGDRPATYPQYNGRLDWSLSAAGAGVALTSVLVTRAAGEVPLAGRDPADIAWRIDRDIVGNRDESADNASDWTRNASLAFPILLTLVCNPGSEGLADLGRRAGVYAETYLLAQGTVRIGKVGFGRARPFAYLPEADRPPSADYDVSKDRTFRSMPSGHAATAWTAVSVGVTEHLLSRPHASSLERISVGVVGGALAGATSAMRVKAGQHFPTDVVAGSALGIGFGVTVPLLHRGDRQAPSRRSVLEAIGGTAAGALLGAMLANTL